MKQTPLAELESQFGRKEAVLVPWGLWLVGGAIVPLLVLVIGWKIALLADASSGDGLKEVVTLGGGLNLSTAWLGTSQGPLRGVVALLIAGILLAMGEAIILLTQYRWALKHSIENEIRFRQCLFDRAIELAPSKSVTGQMTLQSDAVSHWIPQVRDGLLAWYRIVPRHSIQAIACLIPSLLINPAMTLVAMLGLMLLWQLYTALDRRRRKLRPILYDRSHGTQQRLQEIGKRGALLASVHPQVTNRESYEAHLRTLKDAEFQLGDSFLWKAPVMIAVIALMVSGYCFLTAIQILHSPPQLNIAGGMTMTALIALSSLSIVKCARAWSRVRHADSSAAKLLEALRQTPPQAVNGRPLPLPRLNRQITLDHITLLDSSGKKLLEDVNAQITRGSLTALIATSSNEARVLAELFLGFGAPVAGRLLWDDILSSDVIASSVQEQCVWVSSDGPLISGTITENLSRVASSMQGDEILNALRLSEVYDAVFELPDNLLTLVSPNDDRFKEDGLMRLGIARAMLRKPSVVVIQEPEERVKPNIEASSLSAIRKLVQSGAAVVVLPQRLSTLREADQVILLHQHRIAGKGSHMDLLASSELYRHLNYVRFSPLRDVAIG